MLSEPRTISLSCELVHIPMQHSSERLREVYNRVCSSCGYENFIRTADGARIETAASEGGGSSQLVFSRDRFQVADERQAASVEQFGAKVETVLQEAFSVLRVPVILVQQVTVRAAASPNSFRNASEYLAQSVFRLRAEDMQQLGRPANIFGFRLVFPPTQEAPHGFNTRVETYSRDPRSLWIENTGTFKTPLQSGASGAVLRNVLETSRFLADRLLPFLSAYDRREPEA